MIRFNVLFGSYLLDLDLKCPSLKLKINSKLLKDHKSFQSARLVEFSHFLADVRIGENFYYNSATGVC